MSDRQIREEAHNLIYEVTQGNWDMALATAQVLEDALAKPPDIAELLKWATQMCNLEMEYTQEFDDVGAIIVAAAQTLAFSRVMWQIYMKFRIALTENEGWKWLGERV